MTVSTTTNRIAYTGDGVSVAFTVPFLFLANTDIAVYVDGTEVTTGFTTTGAGVGSGTVTFVAAPTTGSALVLVRDPDFLQRTSLPSNGPFPSTSVERMSDKAMIGVQRLSDQIGRALTISDGESAINMTLPAVATRAGRLLAFDGTTGAPEESSFTEADVVDLILRDSQVALRDIVSVDGFTGTETVKLQAAVDALELRGGGTVYVPSTGSTRTLTATIRNDSSGVMIEGAGMWNTTYTRSTDYGDTFFFTGNDATGVVVSDCGIKELKIRSTGLMTSGAHIRTNGVARFECEGIYMQDGFIGFRCEGLTAAYFERIYLVFTNLYGGSASGRRYMTFRAAAATYGHPSCGDVFVSNFNLRGNTAGQVTEYGVNVEASDGIWFSNGHIGNTSVANIRLSPDAATDHIGLLFFDNVMSDEGTTYSLIFDGNSSQGRLIQFVNCTFKGGGICTFGVRVSTIANFYGIQFDNCAVTEFTQTGIYIQSASFLKWSFHNCRIFGNSYTSAGGFPGIRLDNGVQYGEFIGGSSGHWNVALAGTKTSYGLSVGTVSNIRVIGMDLTGNVTGSLLAPGGLTTFVMRGCQVQDAMTVASAGTIDSLYWSDAVFVTGTTNIGSVRTRADGTRCTLIFEGILTVTNGSNLKIGSNFVTTADDVLDLVCYNGNWYQTSRSAN